MELARRTAAAGLADAVADLSAVLRNLFAGTTARAMRALRVLGFRAGLRAEMFLLALSAAFAFRVRGRAAVFANELVFSAGCAYPALRVVVLAARWLLFANQLSRRDHFSEFAHDLRPPAVD